MKEKLSALIDGEVQSDGLSAHLSRLKTDTELREAWDIYHLIGDALRGDLSPGFSRRVAARLSDEPTVLAPQKEITPARRLAWYAMSAAASVAAVSLVVWTALPALHSDSQLVLDRVATETEGLVTASSAPVAEIRPIVSAAEVENYLFAHQPYSHASAMQGVAPYARTIADERGAGKN
jgi:sigma-E factor negative regulatory protein RseA